MVTNTSITEQLNGVELCAGAGGQALGLEQAGFGHAAAVEIDRDACATLRLNRPHWDVRERDLREVSGGEWKGVDLVAGGFPCPPYSVAGKQLGPADDRDLFGYGLQFLADARPAAAMIENVRGILDPRFASVRDDIREGLRKLGYVVDWRLLNASDFGVCQLRPRVIFVALRAEAFEHFRWPTPLPHSPASVGDTLLDLISANGWAGAEAWAALADDIAPTIVGGSKKHGGPDLGPTRARAAWARLGVNGKSLAAEAPEPDFIGMPRLTVRMVARLQGFPDDWLFHGKKTAAYRQVGNAFPAPVAKAVAGQLRAALEAGAKTRIRRAVRAK
jgi:DNA (cytosine-5)-methyltransferase 1